MLKPIFIAGLTMLVCVACSKNEVLQREAVEVLNEIDVGTLRSDAKMLWSSTSKADFDIAPDKWPSSFPPFSPVRVWRYEDGIYIITGKFVSHTAGLYIFVHPDPGPTDARNVKYEKLRDSIYWLLTS